MEILYQAIHGDYQCPESIGIGSRIEPYNTMWLTEQYRTFGPHLKEGLKLIDYGCGIARFANFISQYIKDFSYLGLELDNDHGARCLKYISKNLPDVRIKTDIIDNLESHIKNYDVVLFGSVFTHTSIEFTLETLEKFLKHNYVVVFDVVLGDEYVFDSERNHATNTLSQFVDFVKNRSDIIYKLGNFTTEKKARKHTFFRIEPNVQG